MLEGQPRMITWVIWGSLAAICGGLVNQFGGLALAACGVLALAAVLSCLNWIACQSTRRVGELVLARSMSERVRIIQEVGKLTPEQVKLLEDQNPVVTVLGGEPSPVFALRVGNDVEIPFQFIHEFLDRGKEDSLCPVSSWSEGTRHRQYAEALTNYLVILGFAEPAKGNRAARWLDQARALRWMGI